MSKAGFYWFNTLDEFLAVADTRRETYDRKASDSWRGNEGYQQSRDRCFSGNADNVAKAERLIDEIETGGLIKRGTSGYVQDVAGEFPLVPAYLAGDPDNMLRRDATDLLSDRSPLNVFVDIACGADWGAQELVERGVAILALVMLLNQKRAVTLYWYASISGRDQNVGAVPVVPVQTQPLDLSTASHVLASAGFFRNVVFAFDDAKDGQSWKPIVFGNHTSKNHQEKMRDGLEASPTDLIIYGGANQDQYRGKPLEFVRRYLEQYAPDMLA